MNKLTSTISALALGILGSSATAEELRPLISFPESLVLTQEMAAPWTDLIEEESGRNLPGAVTYPDSIPPFEQFETHQSGVFSLLVTHPAYHGGVT